MDEQAKCELCGEPMPVGEEMFNYHGYSGPCPKPPLPKKEDKVVVSGSFTCIVCEPQESMPSTVDVTLNADFPNDLLGDTITLAACPIDCFTVGKKYQVTITEKQ